MAAYISTTAVTDRLAQVLKSIERVHELHKPVQVFSPHAPAAWKECEGCFDSSGKRSVYPCDTVKALEGEQE